MHMQQATLDSILTKPKEIAQICVLKENLVVILPAGSPTQEYRERSGSFVAPILLNFEGKIEIYKKGQLCGRGLANAKQETINKTLEFAESYSKSNKPEIVALRNQRFDDNSKYAGNVRELWNNADWEFLPPMLENTAAFDIQDLVDNAFYSLACEKPALPSELRQITYEIYSKYAGKIILLARD